MSAERTDLAVRELYALLLDAWNRRSAADYAALFADDGTIIGFDGSVESGQQNIREHLAPIFAHHPTAAYVAKIREVRDLGPGVAVLRAIVGMIPPGATDLKPATNAHQTLIAVQQAGAWRIVLFQNTPAQYHGRPDLIEAHTEELQHLLKRRAE